MLLLFKKPNGPSRPRSKEINICRFWCCCYMQFSAHDRELRTNLPVDEHVLFDKNIDHDDLHGNNFFIKDALSLFGLNLFHFSQRKGDGSVLFSRKNSDDNARVSRSCSTFLDGWGWIVFDLYDTFDAFKCIHLQNAILYSRETS